MTDLYDDQNVFAKILRGELPANKVYEDDKTLAFMDIMPRIDGHTLVVAKSESRNIYDIDTVDLAVIVVTVQKIARAMRSAFSADGITIQHFCEPAGGQVVFHTHFHVLPRHDGVKLNSRTGKLADNSVLAANAEKLKAALAGE